MGKEATFYDGKGYLGKVGYANRKDFVVRRFSWRNIERSCPLLERYLEPHGLYLDVGCGPGSITIDAAKMVWRGTVIGVDNSEEIVGTAAEAAKARRVSNVEFQVGDAHELPFPDDLFDGVFSIYTLGYLDKLRALREWTRVTKPGGWVCANLPNSSKHYISYPPCPTLDAYLTAALGSEGKDLDFGPNALALVSEVGLVDATLELYSAPNVFSMADYYLRQRYPEAFEPGGPHRESLEKHIQSGVLDEERIVQIRAELAAWRDHPHAYATEVMFWASGRVPVFD